MIVIGETLTDYAISIPASDLGTVVKTQSLQILEVEERNAIMFGTCF